ncbi:Crp/Fnr family transcriptional regulator [Zwartia sp.]|uniref:Crp/Fnr family transcriptional regulator n=1 Tax=Zwartia sp. TaxID=2978004 RepID=UPI003BAFA371
MMMVNHILEEMPAAVLSRWHDELEEVSLKRGDVLYQAGSKMHYGYFPVTAIVSILSDLENGSSAEVAVIGNEGVIGASIFMGDSLTSHSAVVLSAGQGYRLKASLMREEFNQSNAVMQVLLCYMQTLIAQMCQTAACNRHHTLNQQLCRLLLLINDRMEGNDVLMTQELLARTLGVRREGVTEAALLLQKSGLIRYSRGRIEILDRAGIEDRSCECYVSDKKRA